MSFAGFRDSILLIVPCGIETPLRRIGVSGIGPFNRTLWN